MNVIKYGESFKGKSAVTIGMFDGVHIGHKLLISKTIEIARKTDCIPIIYTFFNHPVKRKKRGFLTILSEKLCLLNFAGIGNVYLAELNEKFMSMSAVDFFNRELLKNLNAKTVLVGDSFRFGFNREGNADLLKVLGKKSGIHVEIIPTVSVDDEEISSTKIHDYVIDGKIEKANKLLGYSFFITGDVVQGKGRGKLLGFPTANLAYRNGGKILPKKGVYVSIVELDGELYPSVTNVGFNPTFESDNKIRIEVYFLNINENLYGKEVRLHFLKRIRDEKKFESPNALVQAMDNDVAVSREYFRVKKIPEIPICFSRK